jgi:hypothetical protein
MAEKKSIWARRIFTKKIYSLIFALIILIMLFFLIVDLLPYDSFSYLWEFSFNFTYALTILVVIFIDFVFKLTYKFAEGKGFLEK